MATDIDDQLRAAGHRATEPRRLVWQALVEAEAHVTVDELADLVARQHQGVNLASVYRSLTLFEDIGLVRQSRLGDESASRWEVAHPDEQFHMVCRVCGAIEHHEGTLVKSIRDHLADGHHFTAEQVELNVTGVCADCG